MRLKYWSLISDTLQKEVILNIWKKKMKRISIDV